MERNQVYEVINGERDYQEKRWEGTASSSRTGKGATDRTLDEFSLYIAGYGQKLFQIAAVSADPNEKLDVIRKIAALCVGCMEAHGAVRRDGQ